MPCVTRRYRLRHAGADRKTQRTALAQIERRQALENLDQAPAELLPVRVRHEQELITTKPAKSVTSVDSQSEVAGEMDESAVARLVTVPVVDALEVVEVEQRNR